MCKFGIITLTPELNVLYENYHIRKKSIIFALCYDLINNGSTSNNIVEFVNSSLRGPEIKFGAVTKQSKIKNMELSERDYPGMDLESLIIQCKNHSDDENYIDVIHRVVYGQKFPESSYLVVFYKKESEIKNIATLQNLADIFPVTLKLVFINLTDFVANDLLIFIENTDGELIDIRNQDVTNSFSKLRINLKLS